MASAQADILNRAEIATEIRKDKQIYTWDDLVVCRLNHPDTLAYTYMRFKDEGLLDLIYYESPMNALEFIQHYMKESTYTLGCFVKRPESDVTDLVGMGWINHLVQMGEKHRKAEVGMGYFRNQTEVDRLVRFATMQIEWAFEELNLDAIHGATPAKNRAALMFSRKLGFSIVGPVFGYTTFQGELCDVLISSMTRERWRTLHGPVEPIETSGID